MSEKTIADVEEAVEETVETQDNVNFAKASRAAAATLEAISNYGESIRQPKNQAEWLAIYSDRVWAYAGVFAIASTIAQLPLKSYRLAENGDKLYEHHEILDLLETPNTDMTRYDLIEGLVTYMECCGTGYFEVIHGKADGEEEKTPLELWLIRPDRLEPVISKDGKKITGYSFQVKSHTKKIPFALDEVVPFRYFNPTRDWYGLGSLEPAFEALALDKQMAMWNKDFFKHGTTPEGLLRTDKSLTPKEMQDLGKQIKSFLTGATRKILVVSKNLEWQSMSVSPKDAEFLQGRKEARDQILASLGVPSCKVGLVADAKYANYDLQTLSFHRDTIIPKLLKIEGALNKYLLPQFSNTEGIYIEFDKTSLLKEDENQLVTRFSVALRSGFITPNEACRRLGWPTWPDTQKGGDLYYMENRIIAVGSVPMTEGEGNPSLPEEEEINQRLDGIEDSMVDAVAKIKEEIIVELGQE